MSAKMLDQLNDLHGWVREVLPKRGLVVLPTY